jgi:hypothetical protein
MGRIMHHASRPKRIFFGILFGIIFIVVISTLVFILWNWLMPVIFGLPAITIFQAFGLLLLSKILFMGFHKKSRPMDHFKAREYWKKRFEAEHGSPNGNTGNEV